MVAILYRFRVDWDGDGTFAHANADITDRVLTSRPWRWERGRGGTSAVTSRTRAGQLTLPLLNHDGRFSRFNPNSPLSGSILPGRRVDAAMRAQATDAWATVWSGRLDALIPAPSPGQTPAATLTALGNLSVMAAANVRVARQANISTSDAIDDLLDAMNWPAADRDVNQGNTTMRYWSFRTQDGRVSALAEATRIADTEGGQIRESADDEIVFEDRQFRSRGTRLFSAITYSDDVRQLAVELGYKAILPTDPLEDVYNSVRVSVPVETVGSPTTLWELTDVPSIAPDETQRFVARYPAPDTAGQIIGAIWGATTVTGNAAADGSGADLTSSLTVTTEDALDERVVIVENNHATDTVYLTTVSVAGQPVSVGDDQVLEGRDQDSIDAYELREYPHPAAYLPSMDDGLDLIDYVLSLAAEPLPRITITFDAARSAAHLVEALTRELSDKVTVDAEGATRLATPAAEFFVERIAHEVRNDARTHNVTLTLSSAEAIGTNIVLGIGPGLGAGTLAR